MVMILVSSVVLSGTLVSWFIHSVIQNGTSPLFIASQEGHMEVVDVLVKNGAAINQPKNIGRNLWYTHSVYSLLISLTQTGATPLFIASQKGHSDIVNTLITSGADINRPRNVGRVVHCSSLFPLTQDGATPLYIASQKGHSDIVNTLIRNGADINQQHAVLYTCTTIQS